MYSFNDPNGLKHGSAFGLNKKEVTSQLKLKGVNVTSIKKARTLGEKHFWEFLNSLHDLIDQEVTLSEALRILKVHESSNIPFAAGEIEKLLSEGMDFSTSIKTVFPTASEETLSILAIGFVKSGLKQSLTTLVSDKDRNDAYLREFRKIIAYPSFVLLTSLIVLVILFDTILPSLVSVIDPAKDDLTNIIFSFAGNGQLFLEITLWFFIGILSTFYLSKRYRPFQIIFDRLVARLPILRTISKRRTKIAFLRYMVIALDLNAGMKESLRLTVPTVANVFHRKLLAQMEFDVLEGSSFETAIKKSTLFDEGELLRISLAEKSSNLSFVLSKIYEKAAAKQRQEFELFLRLMGPAAILFLGIIVFLVAFVIISPMMTIQQGLS